MNAKLLGIGLLGLTVTGVSAAYFAKQAAPVPAAVAVSAPEPAISESAPSPEPAVSPEPDRSASVPATKPVNSTTVTVSKPSIQASGQASRQASRPSETAPASERPVSTERPVSSEPAVMVEPPAPAAVPVAVAPETQKPRFEEVTLAGDSVLGVSLDSTISSETAKVEDRVNARLSRDVLVDGKVAVPSGARLEGVVTEVVRGGKFKERARIVVSFQTLILADGTKIALTTDPVFRDGEPPANVNAKVGGSGVVGAILGAMIGGKKGAVLGGAAGAAGGAAVVAAGNRAEVTLVSGSSLTVRLKQPITVLVERHHEEPNVSQ